MGRRVGVWRGVKVCEGWRCVDNTENGTVGRHVICPHAPLWL